jgi:hypothetical protein
MLMLAMSWAILSTGVVFADQVMHSGNVTKIDKDKGALEIVNSNGKSEKFTVADKDILASPVWKKRLQVGDGVDVKTDGSKVITVLRRNLPVTIRPPEAAPAK